MSFLDSSLRDEACTLWASGWLTFRRRAGKAFPGSDFNLQVPNEEEAKEFVYYDEVDPEVLSNTLNSVPLSGEAEIPAEAGSSPLPVGALPSDTHALEARTTETAYNSTPNI